MQGIFLHDLMVSFHHIHKAYWVKKTHNDHSMYILLAFINTITMDVLVLIGIRSSADTLIIQYIHPLRLINAYVSVK